MKGPDAARDLILTLDVGTTAVKACVFSPALERLGFAAEEYDLTTTESGFVELDPEVYWAASVRVARKAMAVSGIDPLRIAALGVTSQGETLIPVDVDGRPVRAAIVWLDTRADNEADRLRMAFPDDRFHRTTGIPELGPSCPVAKILWIKEREPEIYARTSRFLLLLDFLLFRLTGRFVTDKCILSSTGYFDIHGGEYWPEMLAALGTESDRLPEILDCGSQAGRVLLEPACDLGIAIGTPVVTAGMDQAASALGAGNVTEGIVTETTGTALVVAATVEKPSYGCSVRVNVMRHAIEGLFLVLPYNQTAGMVLKWFKDEFCQDLVRPCAEAGHSVYACIDALAAGVAPLCGGLLVIPHFMGMLTPEVVPSVRGAFFGVGLDTTRAHFARAILEGIAFMLRENLALLASMGIDARELRSLGGGSKSDLWCRIKAEVSRLDVHAMAQEESASLGAAMLAGLRLGMFGTVTEATEVVASCRIFHPDPVLERIYEHGFLQYRKLLAAVRPMFMDAAAPAAITPPEF